MKVVSFVFVTIILVCIMVQESSQLNKKKYSDLDFIYQQIFNNHPGMYNPKDPSFKTHLNQAYHNAHRLLLDSREIKQQKSITNAFIKSFNDPHLVVHWYEEDTIKPNRKDDAFVIEDIAPNLAWISLPTFEMTTSHEEKQFQSLLRQLPNLRSKSYLVFDLRGNTGGNSQYGNDIITHLFGTLCTINLASYKVKWRVSADNLSHLQKMAKKYKIKELEQLVDGMKLALKNKQHYCQEPEGIMTNHIKGIPCNSINNMPKIILIVDNYNASAALDFIDLFKEIHYPITLVGQTTNADRVYMDVRRVSMPSGHGDLIFPMKVYEKRVRPDNIPYQPDFIYNTQDTYKLKKYVIDNLAIIDSFVENSQY